MPDKPQQITISNAIIKPQLLLTQTATTWPAYLVMGIFFSVITLFLVFSGGDTILLGLFALSFAVLFFAQPNKIGLEFDPLTQTIRFYSSHWFGLKKTESTFGFGQVVLFNRRQPKLFVQDIVEIVLVDGSRFVVMFAQRGTGTQLMEKLSALAAAGAFPMLNSTQAAASASAVGTRSVIQRELRSWQVWLLIIGVGQMFAAGGFSAWGALLMAVALLSFYFVDASMFVVFAITIAWAGISNLFSGNGVWAGMAVIQFILSYQIFRQFRRFRQDEQVEPGVLPSRAEQLFPWLTFFLGGGSFLGFVLVLLGVLATIILNRAMFGAALSWLETISVYSALLGLSTGIASWSSKYPRKWAFVIGTILAALTLLGELGFMVFSRL